MKTIFTFLIVATALLASSCSDTVHGREIAEPQIVLFHDRLDAGQFDLIYDNADAAFKKTVPKQKIEAVFAAIGRKLGKLKTSKQVTWNVSTFNGTTNVVLAYESKFADGEATETFTYQVSDGKAKLVGYNISSLDMLIK